MKENKLIKRKNNLPAVIEDLSQFVLITRERLNAVKCGIKAIEKTGLAQDVYEQKKQEAQDMASMLLHAEVRLGELLSEIPDKKARQGAGTCFLPKGITRNQSSEFQKMANHPDIVERVKQKALKNDDLPTRTAVLNEIRKETEKRVIINNTTVINTDKIYQVIYADPPWSYGIDGQHMTPLYVSRPGDYYPQMSIENIYNFPVQNITDTNAALFLWTPSCLLEKGLHTVHCWGFDYKTSFVWDKILHNMGYYNSIRHEFLLLGIKGSYPLQNKKLFDSVITEERTEHSVKPKIVYEIIETIYPNASKVELFARNIRKGWDSWGNEITEKGND